MEEIQSVRHLIYCVRGENVILDRDIAGLYGVSTGALNQAVKRNQSRFPSDFMFQLSEKEWEVLKSQIVIAKTGRGGTRSLPYAFTEHGVLMLASVLRSNVAAQVSINISMRKEIDTIYEALGALSMQPIQIEPKRIKIGFKRSYED